MHDRPSMRELLDVVQKFLDEEIVPATSGRKQFLARVAANCVRMVDRELGAERAHVARAWEGLEMLLGADESSRDPLGWAEAIPGRLTELCEQIRAGGFSEGSPEYERLLAFLRASVADKLAISNPKLLAADKERGIV